jgi:glycine cleavage system H protein
MGYVATEFAADEPKSRLSCVTCRGPAVVAPFPFVPHRYKRPVAGIEMEERFTESHEWIRLDGNVATVGITKYAADQLGDVCFVELPQAGKKLKAGAKRRWSKASKRRAKSIAPVRGEVTESNSALAGDPAKVNADPEGEAWFFKMKLDDAAALQKLMTRDQYTEFLKGL